MPMLEKMKPYLRIMLFVMLYFMNVSVMSLMLKTYKFKYFSFKVTGVHILIFFIVISYFTVKFVLEDRTLTTLSKAIIFEVPLTLLIMIVCLSWHFEMTMACMAFIITGTLIVSVLVLRKRHLHYYLKHATVILGFSGLSLAILIPFGFLSLYRVPYLQESNAFLSIEDYHEVSDDMWTSYNIAQRMAFMKRIVLCECDALNIRDVPDVIGKYVNHEYGAYYHRHSITFNISYLMNDHYELRDYVKTAIHETRHAYQSQAVQDYENGSFEDEALAQKFLEAQSNYHSLLFFGNLYKYEDNFLELDARVYAYNRIDYYYQHGYIVQSDTAE